MASKPLPYERLLTQAIAHLIQLLAATASPTQGGTRSQRECVACERTGVHTPELRCGCACHTARAFLDELSAALSGSPTV